METKFKCTCYCGSPMKLRKSDKMTYPQSGKPRLFWGCLSFPYCDGLVGAHPNGAPLGFPLDKEGKKYRRETHRLLDIAFKNPQKESAWLHEKGFGNGHVGNMTKEDCINAIKLLRQLLNLSPEYNLE